MKTTFSISQSPHLTLRTPFSVVDFTLSVSEFGFAFISKLNWFSHKPNSCSHKLNWLADKVKLLPEKLNWLAHQVDSFFHKLNSSFAKTDLFADKIDSFSPKLNLFSHKLNWLVDKVKLLPDKLNSLSHKPALLAVKLLSVFQFGASFLHWQAGKLPACRSFGRFRGQQPQPTACAATEAVRP
ncbi:MAG: hypothetical protein WCG79_07635 [Verrucomicrobiota bacterium]